MTDIVERLQRFAKEGAGVAVLIDAAEEIKQCQQKIWRLEKHNAELLARLKASRTDVAATPASGDFSVLPGEDGNFALDQLQSAINDIDISAYNAAKWRIQKAIAVLRAVVASPQAEWQPVETAPHEQRVLLGWWYDGLWISEVAEFSHGWRKGAISNMSQHGQATHWMPLPASPISRPICAPGGSE